MSRGRRLAVLLALLAAGCGDDAGGDAPTDAPVVSGDVGGDAGDAPSHPGDAGPPPSDAPLPTVWNERSRRLQLRCGAGLSGGLRYEATPEELSPQQLAALVGLRVIRPGQPPCLVDGLECLVDVTADDGSKLVIEAVSGDGGCRFQPRLIAMASFLPFYRTLLCRDTLGLMTGGPLPPARGCAHGLSESGLVRLPLEVPTPGTHHLEVVGCTDASPSDGVKLELLNERDVVVAQGQPPADGAPGVCLRLQHDLAVGGSYRVNVGLRGGPSSFGRYYLRYAAGGPPAVSTCAAPRPVNCAPGVSGGICADVRVARECFQGGWVCPFATLNEADCACLGPPPQTACTCGESGWLCSSPGP